MRPRLRAPRTTVRWRLALLYGALFLVSGAALLAITYGLVARAGPVATPARSFTGRSLPPGSTGPPQVLLPTSANFQAQLEQARKLHKPSPKWFNALVASPAGQYVVRVAGVTQRTVDLHQLEIESAIALAIMALISAILGWLIAGRVLRPLRTITAVTQQISEHSLDRRLALDGPPDELRHLADTIDGLLARLQGAFDAQRRFVANASHELRTPLTATRALLEMALTDPRATVAGFRETCRQALEETDQQEQLIDALLDLAHSQRGVAHRELVELGAVCSEVVARLEPEALERGLRIEVSLEPLAVSGDRRLLARLVWNLAQNAVRHNVPGGSLTVALEGSALSVSNTGPLVPSESVDRLLAPFERLSDSRTGREGFGLGLAIVAAIADAHGATLSIAPRDEGGLRVRVCFPHALGTLPELPIGTEPAAV